MQATLAARVGNAHIKVSPSGAAQELFARTPNDPGRNGVTGGKEKKQKMTPAFPPDLQLEPVFEVNGEK